MKLLSWLNKCAVVLLLVWVVLGNIIASDLAKPLLQAKAELIARFPQTEANSSAIKIKELSARLGIYLPRNEVDKSFPPPIDSASFAEIRSDLSTYLGNYLFLKKNDNIDAPNQAIQDYLSTKSAQINDLQNYILQNPIPQWELPSLKEVFDNNNNNYYYGENREIRDIKQIFIVQALNNILLDRPLLAIDNFNAYRKLDQSLLTNPRFIRSYILYNSLYNVYDELIIMRKLDQLSPEWEKIQFPDAHKSLLTYLQIEGIKKSERILNFKLDKGRYYGRYDDRAKSIPLLDKILQIFQQPYWTFAASYNWKLNTEMLRIAEQSIQNNCQFTLDKFAVQRSLGMIDDTPLAKWIMSDIARDYESVYQRNYGITLNWDLTQKVIRLREISRQTGRFPASLPEKDFSPVCNNYSYDYQVSPDGEKMTLSIVIDNANLQSKNLFSYTINPFSYTAHVKRDSSTEVKFPG